MRFPQLREVDLNLLLAFSVLAQTRNVTAAATRLGVTQPSMSRTLARLRALFGDPLFLRGARGLTTTPRAEALIPGVDEVLARTEGLLSGVTGFDPARAERTFRVATSDYAEAVVLPRVLQVLEREAPGVRVRLVTGVGPLEQAFERDGVDLAWQPREPTPRSVVWSRLFDEGFAFVVRRGHPVLKKPFTLERYLSLRHVAIAPAGRSNRNPIDDLLSGLGQRREVVATVPNFLVVPSLIEGSDLGAALPRRMIALASPRYRLETLPLPFAVHGFTVHQGWHERHRKDPGHAWFRQVVVAAAKAV